MKLGLFGGKFTLMFISSLVADYVQWNQGIEVLFSSFYFRRCFK